MEDEGDAEVENMVSDGVRGVKRPGGIRKMRKLQKPRMQSMAEMRMRRKLPSACAVNKHCCCSCELFCILWCPDAQVPPASVTLLPHYRFNFIMFCNQSVVAAGHSSPVRVLSGIHRLPPPRIQTAFPVAAKS